MNDAGKMLLQFRIFTSVDSIVKTKILELKMKKNIVLLVTTMMVFKLASASLYRMKRGSTLQLQCPGNDDTSAPPIEDLAEVTGKPGKRGPQGPPGPPGLKEPDSELRRRYEERISELERQLESRPSGGLGTPMNPANSCKEIKQANASATNGLYRLVDQEGNIFSTYCDMSAGEGGWTLVASVHENNMKGRCKTGDRWSSEQGNSAQHPHGDGFWENRAIHGSASSSTSDDYKNFGYYGMTADDVMIWHVPNDTPLKDFSAGAFLKYYTNTGFLRQYDGNLQSLFSKHYPMRSKTYTKNTDNGPAIPIVWEKGNNAKLVELTPTHSRGETDAGYIQFRAINHQRNAFALCPGIRIKPGKANAEHLCIGSTSYNIGHSREEEYCGDFAARDWPGWNVPELLQKSVVMIFYH